MGNYILRFTKLPKEIKATKRLTLKKKYSLPEARELFYQVQADVGPLDNKMTLEIHRIEGTKDYWEFTLPLSKDVPLDLLIDEDIIQELRNLKGSQKEQFEELENDLLIEFDQPFEPVEEEVNETKPSFLSGLSLPEVKLTEVAENLLSRVLPKKQQAAVPLIEESPSENFVEEALELPEDNYVPDYETVEEEDGVPLEDLEMEKEDILSPQASQDDIVPSTVKGSIPGVVIPPLDAYLDLTTQPIFSPIESLIAKLEAKLDRQTQELIVYFGLADKNDFISERKKEFIRTQYNPTFYKQLISSLYKLKNDVENKLIKKLTIAYQEITADDGSEECLAELAAKKAILSEEFTDKIEAAFTSLENQLALDKARIQKRQQEELERLNKRHQDELYQIDVKLQADKQEKAAQLDQMRQEAIEQEEEKITASYEEKAHKSQYERLIERKNSQLEELSTILVESVQQVTDQELQYLQSMKSKLIESQPVFEEQRRIHEQELREKAVLAQRDRELAIKEKELSLKDKAVQNVESTKQQNQQKEMEISQFLAKLIDDQTRRGAENLATQQQLMAFIQQQQQGTPLQAAPTQPSAVQQAVGKPSYGKKSL